MKNHLFSTEVFLKNHVKVYHIICGISTHTSSFPWLTVLKIILCFYYLLILHIFQSIFPRFLKYT